MQMITMLLVIVSILTLLSGISTFLGAAKGDRARSAWFFVATVFAATWIAMVLLFLNATSGVDAKQLIVTTSFAFISVLFTDAALLGYITWRHRFGKIATLIFMAINLIFTTLVVARPTSFLSEIVLSNTGNSINFNMGPVFFTYTGLSCVLTLAVLAALIRQIRKSKSSRTRNSNIVLLVGFVISSSVALANYLVSTLWTWNFSWLGPLAISTTIVTFYYTILRYRAIKLNSRWLRFLSYVVLMAAMAILYMVVFYLVFLAMFRGSSPSTEVIILNFIMVFFFLLLMPAMNEAMGFVRSLISGEGNESGDGEEKPRQ